MLLRLSPDPRNGAVARRAVRLRAAAAGMAGHRLDDIGLAVGEAVANAVAAQQQVACRDPIAVGVRTIGRRVLEVTVTDAGPGFVPLSSEECAQAAIERTAAEEGGLVVTVMRAVTDHIAFEYADGTTVRMRFILPAGAHPPDR